MSNPTPVLRRLSMSAIRGLLALLLLTLAVSCGSSSTQSGEPAPDAAVWMIDDDANLAYPTCPKCGEVADRSASVCGACGAHVRVEPKTIVCPECQGSKTCAHCGVAHCLACMGTHVCPICDGTGKWHGATCPECEGKSACVECACDPTTQVCDRCNGTHVCSNCDGAGTITLR